MHTINNLVHFKNIQICTPFCLFSVWKFQTFWVSLRLPAAQWESVADLKGVGGDEWAVSTARFSPEHPSVRSGQGGVSMSEMIPRWRSLYPSPSRLLSSFTPPPSQGLLSFPFRMLCLFTGPAALARHDRFTDSNSLSIPFQTEWQEAYLL